MAASTVPYVFCTSSSCMPCMRNMSRGLNSAISDPGTRQPNAQRVGTLS